MNGPLGIDIYIEESEGKVCPRLELEQKWVGDWNGRQQVGKWSTIRWSRLNDFHLFFNRLFNIHYSLTASRAMVDIFPSPWLYGQAVHLLPSTAIGPLAKVTEQISCSSGLDATIFPPLPASNQETDPKHHSRHSTPYHAVAFLTSLAFPVFQIYCHEGTHVDGTAANPIR